MFLFIEFRKAVYGNTFNRDTKLQVDGASNTLQSEFTILRLNLV